jgi:general secretion pathway protein I
VLVAFVILTTALAVLFRIFSGGLHNLSVSGDYSQAVILAQSKLAAVGVEEPLQSGETYGEWEESGYRWRQLVEPYMPWEVDKPLSKPLTGYLVTLEVMWGEGGRERRLSLSSLRLVSEGESG